MSLNLPALPVSQEAEEAVLGALLIDPDAIAKVNAFLKEEDFYAEKRGWIFRAVRDLYLAGQPADLVTLVDYLESRHFLGEVGGIAYVSQLINATPTAVHVEHYAHIVAGKALLRRQIELCSRLVTDALAYDGSDYAGLIARAAASMYALGGSTSDKGLRHIAEAIAEMLNRVEMLNNKQVSPGYSTGHKLLDKVLVGWQRGDLVILAGRPGTGKTAFALDQLVAVAKQDGAHCAMFELEMRDVQLVQRVIAGEAGIDPQRLKTGTVDFNDWGALMEAAGALSSLNIYLDDTPALSSAELLSKCKKRVADAGPLDYVIVDYVQLMRTDSPTGNRVQDISALTRHLKLIARELNVTLLALSQLSRAPERRDGGIPILSDLRESGSLEQDADIVLFTHVEEMVKPETQKKNITDIIVAKHRNGPTDTVPLYFDRQHTKYHDLALVDNKFAPAEPEPEPEPSGVGKATPPAPPPLPRQSALLDSLDAREAFGLDDDD